MTSRDTMFEIDFPPAWQVLPVDGAERAVDHLLDELNESADDPELAAAASNYFTTLTPLLRKAGIEALASLVVGSERPDAGSSFAMAFAAATRERLPDNTPVLDALTSLAEAGSHLGPVVERQTDAVNHLAGPAVRVSTLRHASELADADGMAPFVSNVHYAVAVDHGVAFILHFETPTIVYIDALSTLFDAIAGSVRQRASS